MNYFNKIKEFASKFIIIFMIFEIAAMIYFIWNKTAAGVIICALGIVFFYFVYYFVTSAEQYNRDIKGIFKLIINIFEHISYGNDTYVNKSIDEIKLKNKTANDLFISDSLKKIEESITFDRNNKKLINNILILAAAEKDLSVFLEKAMPVVLDVIHGCCGVFYTFNKASNKLEIKHSIGFGKGIYSQFDIRMNEGFLGKNVSDTSISVVSGIDDDSIYVTKSFLGSIKPKNIYIVPIFEKDAGENLSAVFAVGTIGEYDEKYIKMLDVIREYISYAVSNGEDYNKNLRLTNELKFQNQLIQNLNEELEAKIKERTLFLNSIINSIRDYAVISVDINKRITLFNEGAESMLGISATSAVGQHVKEIKGFEKFISASILEYISVALKSGKSHEICEIKKENGETVLTNLEIFTVYNEIREPNGYTILLNDMSNIKRLKTSVEIEKKMSEIMLVESAKALIVVKETYIIEGISKNAEYVLGTKNSDAIGKIVWEIFDESEKVKKFAQKIFEKNFDDSESIDILNEKMKISMKAIAVKDDIGNVRKAIIYL